MKIRFFFSICFFVAVCFVFSSCEDGSRGETDDIISININIEGKVENADIVEAIERALTAVNPENNGSSPDKALNISFSGFSTGDNEAMSQMFLGIEGYYVNLDLSGLSGTAFSYYSLASTVDKSKILDLTLSTKVTSFPDSSNGIFQEYKSLKSVTADGVIIVGNSVFYNCTALESVSLSAAENVGASAFINCAAMKSISLPNVKTIGDSAFYNCTALESVNLPVLENTVGGVFSGCTALKTVSLPKAKNIVVLDFYDCTALESVDLPVVENIGFGTFWNCTALKSINLGINAPTVGTTIFNNGINASVQTITVKVPVGASGYGTLPVTLSGADSTQNWGNAFRGIGWDGSSYLTGTVNEFVTLVIGN